MTNHINQQKPQLKLLVGVSGSGKTTWATEFIKKNSKWVRVNRDDIRRNILGKLDQDYYLTNKSSSFEKHINVLQDEQIRYWLHQGMNVILDNTNLRPQYIDHFHSEFGHLAEISYEIFDIGIDECKNNVIGRDGNINTDYINSQHKQFMDMIAYLHAPKFSNTYGVQRNNKLKKAIIVDIDGTVADCTGIRSPYDGENLHKDRPILPVKLLLNRMKGSLIKRILDPVTIIYLSGREDKWKDGTIKWLKSNGFPFDGHMYMRRTNDLRKDSTVKEELYFKNVHPKFDTQFVIDDRLQVCHNCYKMGLFCLNVNQGLKHF
jgi:predicted kinase